MTDALLQSEKEDKWSKKYFCHQMFMKEICRTGGSLTGLLEMASSAICEHKLPQKCAWQQNGEIK